jgi:hypothetical protein
MDIINIVAISSGVLATVDVICKFGVFLLKKAYKQNLSYHNIFLFLVV